MRRDELDRDPYMLRWSFVVVCVGVMLMFVWSSAPPAVSVKFTDGLVLALPRPVSRWWGIAAGPVYVTMFALMSNWARRRLLVFGSRDLHGLFLGEFAVAFAFGAFFVPGVGLHHGLLPCLGAALFTGAVSALIETVDRGWQIGLVAMAVVGSGFMMSVGFVFTLAEGLPSGIAAALVSAALLLLIGAVHRRLRPTLKLSPKLPGEIAQCDCGHDHDH